MYHKYIKHIYSTTHIYLYEKIKDIKSTERGEPETKKWCLAPLARHPIKNSSPKEEIKKPYTLTNFKIRHSS